MRKNAFCLLVLFCSAISLSVSAMAQAGTTVIEVRTEGIGDIIKDAGETNLNGAMVWNGTEWVVNDTWAHMFFFNIETGERLKNYDNPQNYSGTSPTGVIATYGPYTITRNIYSHTKTAKTGPDFIYRAVEYVIHDNVTGREVILRSRGTGNGTGQPYFDIYIEDEMASGVQTTAFRNDPVWFTYPGMTASQAVNQTDPAAHRTGHLPGAMATQSTRAGDYYLDIGGGSDMGPAGTGRSFEFHTSESDPADSPAENLGSAFPVDFNLKYMDSEGNLHMLHFEPAIVSERRAPLPGAAIPTLNQWGMILFMVLTGASAVIFLRQKKSESARPDRS